MLAALSVGVLSAQFPNGAKLEKLYEGGHLTEGAAVGPDGAVYFSDVTFTTETSMQAGHILRYDPATGKTSVYRSPSGMSNGIKFDSQDRMVVAEGARLWRPSHHQDRSEDGQERNCCRPVRRKTI